MAVLASCGSGVIKAQVAPLSAEEFVHDSGAQFWVRFTFLTVKVRFAEVPEIMDEKCDPKPRIQRRAVELGPGCRDEEWVQKKLVCAKEKSFCSEPHGFSASAIPSAECRSARWRSIENNPPLRTTLDEIETTLFETTDNRQPTTSSDQLFQIVDADL